MIKSQLGLMGEEGGGLVFPFLLVLIHKGEIQLCLLSLLTNITHIHAGKKKIG